MTFGDPMKLLSNYAEQPINGNTEIINWENHTVNDQLFYSYRDTAYDRRTFPSNLHYHDYYELVVFEEGDIQYVCEGRVYYPKHGDVVLIPPGKFHMSVINCENTRYRRHVFYLYPTAFDAINCTELTSFLGGAKSEALFSLSSPESRRLLMHLFQSLKNVLNGRKTPLEDALGLSYVIHIFYLLNQTDCQATNETTSLPPNILALQRYIDQNYCQISSVTQVAEHFFYSREYVSRLFRKYFDTTISDYIMKRRIAKSQMLILQGLPMIEIAYQSGFGSLSTFIRAFRSVTNITPSEYRKLHKKTMDKE